MRILIAPELYGANDRLENNTMIMDMAVQVGEWLEQDPNVHVYWMLPREEDIKHYDESVVHGDHERVTIFNRRRFGQNTASKKVDSWTEEQLEDLRETIRSKEGWFDVVISLHPESQDLLWRYLHDAYRHTYTSLEPFSLVYYCWNFNSEYKGHSRYRNHSPVLMDLTAASVADDVWVKHEWDHEDLISHARTYMSYDIVKEIDDKSRYMSMPVNFDAYDPEFSDEPTTFHLNDTLNMESEHIEEIIDIAGQLYARYDIEMIITSDEDNFDDDLKRREYVTFFQNPGSQRYRNILSRADIGLSITLDESQGIRPIEQLASGQVLVPVRRPWVNEFLDDYKFTASGLDDGLKYLSWIVNNWDEAVEEAKSAQETLKQNCSSEEIAQESLDRMYDLVDERTAEYDFTFDQNLLSETLDDLGDGPHTLNRIDEVTARYTDSGSKLTNIFGYTMVDMIAALRKMGWHDTGAAEPAFDNK